MKILMIGLGSIGQRHLRNIKRIYGDGVSILAYRVRGLERTFSDAMQIRENIKLEEEYGIVSFSTLKEALEQKPEIAFITNPTKLHVETALQCIKAGCHIFMEKPVSDQMDRMNELREMVSQMGVKFFVGYQNRLHPGIGQVKKCLAQNEIGNVISVRSVVGERLTTMHTYEDYKDTYMAKSDLGGGVVTNQMVHEMDYLYYLFGLPESVYACGGTLGGLPIDVEDTCEAVFCVCYKEKKIPVSVHADFYQSPPERTLQVVGDRGKIVVDFIANQVIQTVNGETTITVFEEFNRNDMFIEELKLFMECINKDEEPFISLEDGIVSLAMASAVKDSMRKGGRKHEFTF